MVFNFMTFDPDDEYLNNRPGSPPYYGPSCPSFSSSDSSSAVGVCNGCLSGISSGLVLPVSEPSHAGQRFSSPFQVQQPQNRGRDGNNNFLLKLINGRLRYHSNRADDSEMEGKLVLGQIRHDNVVPLRGYLISRDKSLMLYDYYSQESVHSMMQGRKCSFDWEMPCSLNWERRLKIVTGAVRGIAYIHKQNGGKLFHGNLTSSNVFINSQGYGCVSEICCNTLKSEESPYSHYNPNIKGASQASDIYGLGLLMLELLFGDIPLDPSGEFFLHEYYDKIDDIFYFDGELSYWKCMPMLKLALGCMTMEIAKRCNIKEVIEMVESIYI